MPDKIQHNKQPKTQQDVAHSKSKNRETCMLENRHQNIQPKTPQDVVHFRSTNRATGMLENKHQNIQPKTPPHVVHFRSSYRATCMHTTVQQQSHVLFSDLEQRRIRAVQQRPRYVRHRQPRGRRPRGHGLRGRQELQQQAAGRKHQSPANRRGHRFVAGDGTTVDSL